MFVDQDMPGLHEGFGKEGTGASNSTIRAREISPGRFLAIATARSRTISAGGLLDIRLGDVETHDSVVSAPHDQAEANATSHLLTPDVPLDDSPSSTGVGRYHDAFALDATDRPDLVVSWADHVQPIDVFGMSLFNEPIWFSGRAGEAARCGGCHEDRTHPPVVSQAQLATLANSAVAMFGTTPRAQRLNTAPTTATQIVGVGWTTQVQPILDDVQQIRLECDGARSDQTTPRPSVST